ncbi:MAG TPA: ATP-binding cassette domain-containing protein [Acidimicrobiales bacterium]
MSALLDDPATAAGPGAPAPARPPGTRAAAPPASPAEPALELYHLRAGYGRVEVLHGVDLALPRGSVLALMGPNGAGKTTLLNVAAGILRPSSGCVHIAGLHVNDVPPEVRAEAGVCSIPEARGTFPNLTVNENLRVFTHAGNQPYRLVQDRAFTRFPRLGERRNQLAGTLSGGERQMLACAGASPPTPLSSCSTRSPWAWRRSSSGPSTTSSPNWRPRASPSSWSSSSPPPPWRWPTRRP